MGLFQLVPCRRKCLLQRYALLDMGQGGTDSGTQIVLRGSQPINYSNFSDAAVVPVELLDCSVE